MSFPRAPAGARRILGGWRWSDWFWRWWCSRRMTKRSSTAGSGRGGGGSERRVQSRSTPSEAKPWSLWTCESCCHTQGVPPATWLHQGITTLTSTSRYTLVLTFKLTSKMWGGMMWHIKDHNRSQKLCFHHPGHAPVIRGNLDLHFEDSGNGPVVITSIGREHEFYTGASTMSLGEHCVTFRPDRRLLSLLGFVHNWPTSRWSARKPVFINGNEIVSSFLGWQFYRFTLYNQDLALNKLQWLICHKTKPSKQRTTLVRFLNKRQQRLVVFKSLMSEYLWRNSWSVVMQS